MQYQSQVIDSLFQSPEPIELSREIISKRLIQGIDIEVILKTPDDINQKDIIKLKPMSTFECLKFSEIFAKFSQEYYGNVNEILTGNGKLFFIKALEEFLLQQNKNNSCKLIEYNGVEMDISEIKANIFSDDTEYENINYIFAEIIDFFSWNYCFFLGWRDTALVFLAECNLIWRQINLLIKHKSERDLFNQAIKATQEAEEQAQEILKKSQKKLKDTQTSKKLLKQKATGSNV
jgi:hypothetical protein